MSHRLTYRARAAGTLAAAMLAIGALSACGTPNQPPQQVRTETPRVTYNYRGDQELLQASNNAAAFCAQYQSVEHPLRFTSESNGTTTAIFECLPAPAPMTQRPVAPSMTYSYHNDQELLDASRNAQSQCPPSGAPMTSIVSTDGNGNRTVTFQCGRG